MKNMSRDGSRVISPARAALTPVLMIAILLFSAVSAGAAQSTSVPWSGYWWPFMYGGLGTGIDYRGRPAPLEKYNLLTTGVTSGEALTQYLNAFYDPNAPAWYGLCAYWARAACYEHINIFPSSEQNIIFRVGDKKGLLTLIHNGDLVETDDGSRPEVFHYWLLHYIGDLQKAFVADLAAGTEVWSYPVYRYEMRSSISGSTQSVETTVYYADDFVSPDFMGTQVRSTAYTYDLFLNGAGAITGGQWTGNSVADHPELLNYPMAIGSGFPGLNYQEIVRLARSMDDPLENQGNAAAEIAPGTYQLVLLNEDTYTVNARPGDTFSLRIEKQAGSWKDMEAVVTDGNGNELVRKIITSGVPLDDTITAVTAPYTIRLTQDDYTADPNIYTLALDLSRAFSQEVPYIPKSGDWSGFTLTNAGETAVDGVTLTSGDGEGAPIQTLLGPLRLEPGEKRRFFFSDFPIPMHELIETERLTLAADGPVELLNLIGSANSFLATFVQQESRASRLILPDTAAPMTPKVRLFSGVRNEGFEDAQVRLRLYSATGILQKEVTETIAGRGYLSIKPGSYPFYDMPASGWIDVQGNTDSVLSGFQYLSNTSGVETLFALPMRGAEKKIVPHVAAPGSWITRVTLINPNNSENSVRFHLALAGADRSGDYNIVLAPREKRVVEVQDLFAKPAGDPLYHSALEITGLYPLAGYYTYNVPGRTDNASYPLLDENAFKNVLHLPHYAGNSYWWTGVVICNPLTVAQMVRMEPYDLNGNLMADRVQTLNLNAGAYEVFDVKARFGQAASTLSFMVFRTENASGAIGGFYLYGNHKNKNILSGSNM